MLCYQDDQFDAVKVRDALVVPLFGLFCISFCCFLGNLVGVDLVIGEGLLDGTLVAGGDHVALD